MKKKNYKKFKKIITAEKYTRFLVFLNFFRNAQKSGEFT